MTEASGKKNRMFAGKNILRHTTPLILFSVFLCASYSLAQQQPETEDNRRIERLGDVSTDEWEMDLSLPDAGSAVSAGSSDFELPDEAQNKQLQQLFSSLAANPGDPRLLRQLDALLTSVLDQVHDMMDAGSLDQAEQLLTLIQSVNPGLPGLNVAKNRLQDVKEADELLVAGNAALASSRVLEPGNSSAFYYFSQALKKDPQSQSAQQGLARVQRTLVERALESARELDFETAEAWLSEASAIREDQKPVEDVRIEVANFKQEHAAELEQKVFDAMSSGNFVMADFSLIDLIALGGQESGVASLRSLLEEARFYGGFEPGQVISDELLQAGGTAPEIVIISAGSFLMGSPERSDGVLDNEKPQHRVTIKHGFGLGVREVTVDEFRLFIESTGYRTAAERSGNSSIYNEAAGRLGRRDGINWRYDYRGKKAKPDLPVLHVNVNDAQAYVQWLARETGKGYRLPSEAEYEYVARAGGRGTYWWGEGSPGEVVENLTGERDKSPSKREWTTSFKKYGDGHWGPAPAGTLGNDKLVHPMGVYDIAGNVSEWTEDCWHQNYIKAPVDGSAWVNPGCNRRVRRGGYWASAPEQSRAAFRTSANAESYGPIVGIRIARDL